MRLFFDLEDAHSPRARKDDLWWTYSLITDRDLVMQHNGGSCMLVAHALWWTIWGGRMSGGQTVGGENNHTPKKLSNKYA